MLSLEESKIENSRAEPIKMSWITDFKLICPDRDILVVRECLSKVSKQLAVALEDKTTDSLEIQWHSSPIIAIMKVLHNFSGQDEIPEMTMTVERFEVESAMVSFCLRYEIEPLFTSMKSKMIEMMTTTRSNGKWIKFFHDFRNADGSEIFKEQTDSMRLLVINSCRAIRAYFNNEGKNKPHDIIDDYRFIITGLAARLTKMEGFTTTSSGCKITVSMSEIESFLKLIKSP